MDYRVKIGPKDKMILKITLKFDTYYITSPNFLCPTVIENISNYQTSVSFEGANMNQHPRVH
jgi:hypothetical protein